MKGNAFDLKNNPITFIYGMQPLFTHVYTNFCNSKLTVMK